MKTKTLLFISLLMLLAFANISGKESSEINNIPAPAGSISIYCTADIYDMAVKWAAGYNKTNPGEQIHIIDAGTGFSAGSENIAGIMRGEEITSANLETAWKMSVGRDVTVPVINSGNPHMDRILDRGVTEEAFAKLLSGPDKQVWGTLLENGSQESLHLYITDDESVKSGIKRYLGVDRIPADRITFVNNEELLTAVQNDPYALGFCTMAGLCDQKTGEMAANLHLVPIDRNGNGKMDSMERIYDDLNTFSRAVWIGKYPKALYSDIYYVSSFQPRNESEAAFVKWILTDGQQYLSQAGHSSLVYGEIQSKLNKIDNVPFNVAPEEDVATFPGWLILLIAIFIVGGIVTGGVIRYRRTLMTPAPVSGVETQAVFDESSVKAPAGLFFDRTHTWAFMEKDGLVRIGIDDFLQHITGTITRVEMKKPGDFIRKGEAFLSIIQEGKQLHIYAPVSGIIRENNRSLVNHSSLINSDPYAAGWIYMIEPANWIKETQLLSMAIKYRSWLSNEFTRVKDFLTASLQPNRPDKLVYQDGGTLKDNILAEFGPETWEEFQTRFLDTSK